MFNDRSAPEDFSTLLLRLYRLAQELPIQQFQDAALAQIKLLLPFDSSMWGTGTVTSQGIDIHSVHLHEKSPEMLVAYEPVKHLDTATFRLAGKTNTVVAINAEQEYGGRASKDQADMREFLRRFQHENMLIVADSHPRTRFAHWVSLYRADPDAHCTPDESRLLQLLAPHVMQALALNRVMHLEQLDAVDKAMSPYGSAIADARGVLYHADPAFRGLAEAEWSDWHGPELPQVLLAAMAGGQARYLGRTLVVRHWVEQGLIFLKARARCLADQLTAREHTIASLIAKGQSHKEIAQTLERSPATVRNQIQVIYDKLQVSSIAALIETLRQAA
ncbi:helix-turn-helix transcriptional regulator [Variovorax sp. HJSM1_2]|uniref:helix-turn-helix transcriptional regulator n=1 Tax=Variovorax sp. HJSM1_2 TaxID=3366263 RepID=UPI003BC0371D